MNGTRISTMRGIRGEQKGNIADIPTNLYFDYAKYTEGEFDVLIEREKKKLYAAMYPDSPMQKQWQKSINRIDNALYNGLYNFAFTGLWSSEESQVAKAIQRAKSLTNPANGAFLSNRRNPSVGVDPLIPIEDSYEKCKIFLNNNYGTTYGSCVVAVDAANRWKTQLNDPDKGLEKASHQFLYNWVTNNDLNNESLAFENRYKMRLHRENIFELERLSGLSSENLANWISLGVMRRSALKLGEVMSPEQTIAFLKQYTETPILEVGDPRADALGNPLLIIAIAVLILAAFIGVSGLVQVSQGHEPTAFKYISQLSALTNSPGGKDWISKAIDILPTGGGSTTGGCPVGYKKNAAGLCVKNGGATTGGSGFSLTDPLVIAGGAVVLAGGIYFATK